MFRKKNFLSGSGSRAAAPEPRVVPVPMPPLTEPSNPLPPAIATSPLKDIVAPRRPSTDGLPSSSGRTLVIGRDIVLNGEIETCETLIIEGRVEGGIADTRRLEISESGRFKGRAKVEDCVVAGACEGEITVAGLLTVRSKGRITGKVRYAEIEMQRGGRLSGEVEILTVRAVPDPAESRAESRTESQAESRTVARAAPAMDQKPGPG
jgi:cytoskeletal protein CcmA (bactofilin family)